MDWKMAGLVAVGGAAGSVARYALSGWATRGDFPLGTLIVNVVGCFLIGLLLFGGAAGDWLGPGTRVLLGVGLLGGFTTMSTFTYETVRLAEEAAWGIMVTNLAGTLVSCLAATWLGRAVGLALWSGGT